MARIRRADTKPEVIIRSGLHRLGWRFRLGEKYKHEQKFLPGKPDLVFPGRRAVVFVNGCFWHGHDCARFRWPATNVEFWRSKIGGNITRDRKVREELAEKRWRVLDIWECVLVGRDSRPIEEIMSKCTDFLVGSALFQTIGPSGIAAPD